MGELRRAVFLDRDGVLNVDKGYVFRSSDLSLLPGAAKAVAELKRRGYLVIVVSNQSGVARGLYSEQDVHAFNAALGAALTVAAGASFDAIYYCPHLATAAVQAYLQECSCRKPAPGMVLTAARDHGIDLNRSRMVGDKPDDVECAVRAGVKGIQILRPDFPEHPQALAYVDSLHAALSFIPE